MQVSREAQSRRRDHRNTSQLRSRLLRSLAEQLIQQAHLGAAYSKNEPASFETLDDKGMPNARYTYDAFFGTEQKDGMVELIFINLKQQ